MWRVACGVWHGACGVWHSGGEGGTSSAEHAESASLPMSMHEVKRTWYETSAADWRLRSKWIMTG